MITDDSRFIIEVRTSDMFVSIVSQLTELYYTFFEHI